MAAVAQVESISQVQTTNPQGTQVSQTPRNQEQHENVIASRQSTTNSSGGICRIPAFAQKAHQLPVMVSFLKPNFTQEPLAEQYYAVRTSERFEGFEAMYPAERVYVRMAAQRATHMFFIRPPGGNPLLVFKGILQSSIPGDPAARCTKVELPVPATENVGITCDIPKIEPIRVVLASADLNKISFSHLGLLNNKYTPEITTAILDLRYYNEVRNTLPPHVAMPQSIILQNPDPKRMVSVRTGRAEGDKLLQVVLSIQKHYQRAAISIINGAIRLQLPEEVQITKDTINFIKNLHVAITNVFSDLPPQRSTSTSRTTSEPSTKGKPQDPNILLLQPHKSPYVYYDTAAAVAKALGLTTIKGSNSGWLLKGSPSSIASIFKTGGSPFVYVNGGDFVIAPISLEF